MGDVILLAGLGFGDEGKGTICDRLVRDTGSKLVVRYNGGAQAAHTVVLDDGRHHTFSQFGSGTLAGASTHLSRHMLVNPLNLLSEARALESFGIVPTEAITLEREALVTNFFQVTANRVRELTRGVLSHGSCGLGIGETVSDHLANPDLALRIGDLSDKALTRKKLEFSRDRKLAEFGSSPPGTITVNPFSDGRIDYYVDLYAEFARRYQFVDRDYLPKQMKRSGTTIFEGAQGVLLDQDYGFHPYTTWSDTTFGNAYDLLQGFDGEVRKIGVLRGYLTRHGAGPFPTETTEPNIESDAHNVWGEFQQSFRIGHFDCMLARYALDVVGGVDELALTNLDRLKTTPKICTGYRLKGETFLMPAKQKLNSELTKQMFEVEPRYGTLGLWSLLDCIAGELRTPIDLLSFGPRASDKRSLKDIKWL